MGLPSEAWRELILQVLPRRLAKDDQPGHGCLHLKTNVFLNLVDEIT